MKVYWPLVNYTATLIGIALLTALLSFGLWRTATPESGLWLPLGIAAFVIAAVTAVCARKLLQQPRASEGIGAVSIFILALGLLASGLWLAAIASIDTGFKAALLLPCFTGVGYLVLIATDCISTERRLQKRK